MVHRGNSNRHICIYVSGVTMTQVINFLQSSETNTVDNGTLTVSVNQSYPYGWLSQSTFNGAFLSYQDIDVGTSTPATSTANSASPNINLQGQKWNAAIVNGTLNSGSLNTAAGTDTAYAYIDGVQVATISSSANGDTSTTFSFPSGSHTLKVQVVSAGGSSSSKSYSATNFNAITATLTVVIAVVNPGEGIYSTYATCTYQTASGSSQPVTNSIATDANGDLVLTPASGQAIATTNNVLDDGTGNMSILGNFDASHQIATTVQNSITVTAWTGAMQMSAGNAATWENGTGRTCFALVMWNSTTVALATTGTVYINMEQNTSTGKIYFLIMANGAVITNPNYVGYGVYWVAL